MVNEQVIDETAELEAAGKRERPQLTDAQKQAAGLRREITMLSKYPGNEAHIAKLQAQADELAPVAAKQGRTDPLRALTADEQHKLRTHFEITKGGFAKLAAVVSYKKLAEVMAGL